MTVVVLLQNRDFIKVSPGLTVRGHMHITTIITTTTILAAGLVSAPSIVAIQVSIHAAACVLPV